MTCPHIYTQKTDIAIQFVYCEIGKLARILVTYSSQYARSGMEDALQRLKKGIEAEDEAENEAELAEADDEDGVCAAIHPMGVAVSVNKATGHFGSVGHNGVALVAALLRCSKSDMDTYCGNFCMQVRPDDNSDPDARRAQLQTASLG